MSRILAVELREILLPLVRPFRTSFGVERDKRVILAKIETEKAVGWGECVAGPEPGFSEEFNDGVWLALREFLVPALLAAEDSTAALADLPGILAGVRGNRMAKATLEMALLDAELRERGQSLSAYLGGRLTRVACGVSVGIPDSIGELLDQVADYLAAGYRRIKLKIQPGFDVEPVTAVRQQHPDVLLSVDANAAYEPASGMPVFEALDQLDLLMIEQPFSYEDLALHAVLQERLRTAICLDESIRSEADAITALQLGSCRIINIKQGRVGGLGEAVRIHDVARAAGIPVWCGGMLETGIGRAANLALASLPGFILPGDISASARYFPEDVTEPFVVDPDGTMAVPAGPGLGVEPHVDRLEACTTRVLRLPENE
jgi:O-succinylbenzoate synthase